MDTLLNWIWQGTLVAFAATLLLHVLRIRSAAWKYRFWWASMAVVLLLPAIAGVVWTPAPMPAASHAPSADDATLLPDVYVSDVAPLAIAVVAAWGAWVAVCVLRTLLALVAVRRVRKQSTPFPAGREARLEHWMALRRSGNIALVVSDDVRTAAVVGLSAPSIAVSPRLLRGLTDGELDRVLVHEWAHVDRRDHILHAAQLLVRILAGCHPAVWWMDRQLEAERESACDEMVVRVTGSPKAYAACLARLAEINSTPGPSLPVPAAISSSHVRTRIVRVLRMDPDRGERRLRTRTGLAAAGVFLIGFHAASAALVLPVAETFAPLVQILPVSELRTQIPGPFDSLRSLRTGQESGEAVPPASRSTRPVGRSRPRAGADISVLAATERPIPPPTPAVDAEKGLPALPAGRQRVWNSYH